MAVSDHFSTPSLWAETHFGLVSLGDKRRNQRVQTLASAFLSHPGESIPQLFCGQPYLTKAAYHLLGLSQATPDALQATHRQVVRQCLQEAGVYLLIEDTTEMCWKQRPPRETTYRSGLGPVGSGTDQAQGFLLHSVVAAQWIACDQLSKRPALPLLGLIDQQFYLRQPAPAQERDSKSAKGGSRLRMKRERESRLWSDSLQRIGPCPADSRWVVVADRGADVYEHLQQCHQQGCGFVVRAAQDRALVNGPERQPAGHLFAVARSLESVGHFSLRLRSRPGQAKRLVELQVSYSGPLALRAPQRPGGATGKGQPIACSVVRVWQESFTEAEPLEWILLCDQPLNTYQQAKECVLQYASRWLIEDFHKALKTGLGAEKLQLQTAARLFAAIALMSVVALSLVDLREKSRRQPQLPAQAAGLEALFLIVLAAQSPTPRLTVKDVVLALAHLGGHLNRKADGMPGWKSLWLGMSKLRTLVEGVRLAALIKGP